MPSLKFAQTILEIVDPDNIAPVSADLIVENRTFDGIHAFSFASIINDGQDGKPVARVVARIRLGGGGLLDLQRAIEEMLKPPPAPPKEQVN